MDLTNNSIEISTLILNNCSLKDKNKLIADFELKYNIADRKKLYKDFKNNLNEKRKEVTQDNLKIKLFSESSKFFVDQIADNLGTIKNPLSNFLIKGSAKIGNSVIDFFTSEAYEANRQDLDIFIENHAHLLFEQANLIGINNKLIDYEVLEELNNEIGFSREDSPILNKVINEKLIKKLKSLDKNSVKKIELEKHKIEVKKNIQLVEVRVTNSIKNFKEVVFKKQKETLDIVNKIGEEVISNSKKINQLEVNDKLQDNLIAINTFKIECIEAFNKFDKLTIEDKIKELGSGGKMSKYLNSNKREELKEELKTIKFNQDVITVCNHISKGGALANKLISTFSKGKGASSTQKTINTIITAASVVGNFYAGNYPGAAMQALDLFGGGGGPSQEVQMLQQIIGQLNEIQEQLNIIENKIDNISKMLFEIHKDLMNRFSLIDEKLIDLEFQIRDSINLNLEILTNNLDQCSIIRENYDQINFKSYNNLLNHYESGSQMNNCLNGLRDALTIDFLDKKEFDESLYIHHSTDANSVEIFDRFNPVRLYFIKVYGKQSVKNQSLLSAFLIPINNYNTYIKNNDQLINIDNNGNNRDGLFLHEKYLNKYGVIDIGNFFLQLLPYYELLDSSNKMKSIDKIIGNKSKISIKRNIHYLENLFLIVNNTIIQQNIYSGIFLLEKIYSSIFTKKSDSEINLALDLILNNPFINHNFIVFILNKYLNINISTSKWDNIIKTIATEQEKLPINELKEIDILSNPKIKISYSKENMFITLRHILTKKNKKFTKLIITHKENIRNGQFVYPREITSLNDLQSKTLNKLTELRFITDIKGKNEKDKINYIITSEV